MVTDTANMFVHGLALRAALIDLVMTHSGPASTGHRFGRALGALSGSATRRGTARRCLANSQRLLEFVSGLTSTIWLMRVAPWLFDVTAAQRFSWLVHNVATAYIVENPDPSLHIFAYSCCVSGKSFDSHGMATGVPDIQRMTHFVAIMMNPEVCNTAFLTIQRFLTAPTFRTACQHLQYLHIYDGAAAAGEKEIAAVAAVLRQCRNTIRVVSLVRCNLTDRDMTEIVNALSLDDRDAAALEQREGQRPLKGRIERLGHEPRPRSHVAPLPCLEELCFADNLELTDACSVGLIDLVSASLSTLHTIDISHTNIGSGFALRLPRELAKLHRHSCGNGNVENVTMRVYDAVAFRHLASSSNDKAIWMSQVLVKNDLDVPQVDADVAMTEQMMMVFPVVDDDEDGSDSTSGVRSRFASTADLSATVDDGVVTATNDGDVFVSEEHRFVNVIARHCLKLTAAGVNALVLTCQPQGNTVMARAHRAMRHGGIAADCAAYAGVCFGLTISGVIDPSGIYPAVQFLTDPSASSREERQHVAKRRRALVIDHACDIPLSSSSSNKLCRPIQAYWDATESCVLPTNSTPLQHLSQLLSLPRESTVPVCQRAEFSYFAPCDVKVKIEAAGCNRYFEKVAVQLKSKCRASLIIEAREPSNCQNEGVVRHTITALLQPRFIDAINRHLNLAHKGYVLPYVDCFLVSPKKLLALVGSQLRETDRSELLHCDEETAFLPCFVSEGGRQTLEEWLYYGPPITPMASQARPPDDAAIGFAKDVVEILCDLHREGYAHGRAWDLSSFLVENGRSILGNTSSLCRTMSSTSQGPLAAPSTVSNESGTTAFSGAKSVHHSAILPGTAHHPRAATSASDVYHFACLVIELFTLIGRASDAERHVAQYSGEGQRLSARLWQPLLFEAEEEGEKKGSLFSIIERCLQESNRPDMFEVRTSMGIAIKSRGNCRRGTPHEIATILNRFWGGCASLPKHLRPLDSGETTTAHRVLVHLYTVLVKAQVRGRRTQFEDKTFMFPLPRFDPRHSPLVLQVQPMGTRQEPFRRLSAILSPRQLPAHSSCLTGAAAVAAHLDHRERTGLVCSVDTLRKLHKALEMILPEPLRNGGIENLDAALEHWRRGGGNHFFSYNVGAVYDDQVGDMLNYPVSAHRHRAAAGESFVQLARFPFIAIVEGCPRCFRQIWSASSGEPLVIPPGLPYMHAVVAAGPDGTNRIIRRECHACGFSVRGDVGATSVRRPCEETGPPTRDFLHAVALSRLAPNGMVSAPGDVCIYDGLYPGLELKSHSFSVLLGSAREANVPNAVTMSTHVVRRLVRLYVPSVDAFLAHCDKSVASP